MLVASKYEEIWAPEVKDFVYISDEAYSREQILEMEKIMLNTLRFNLTIPTPFTFLSRFLKAAGASKDTLVSSLCSCPVLRHFHRCSQASQQVYLAVCCQFDVSSLIQKACTWCMLKSRHHEYITWTLHAVGCYLTEVHD